MEFDNVKIVPIDPRKFARTLILDCDEIHLTHNKLGIDIQVDNDKISNIDYIVVNGIKFKKVEE